MNVALWVLQVLAALLFAASGVMKVFLFEKVSADVPSFGAMPRRAWTVLGVLEMVCAVALILPGVLHAQPMVTIAAAAALALESLIFIWVHLKYKEPAPIAMSALLGLVMAFVMCGRLMLLYSR